MQPYVQWMLHNLTVVTFTDTERNFSDVSFRGPSPLYSLCNASIVKRSTLLFSAQAKKENQVQAATSVPVGASCARFTQYFWPE